MLAADLSSKYFSSPFNLNIFSYLMLPNCNPLVVANATSYKPVDFLIFLISYINGDPSICDKSSTTSKLGRFKIISLPDEFPIRTVASFILMIPNDGSVVLISFIFSKVGIEYKVRTFQLERRQ
jgi:hypothetical protein